jgi:hypothetical protein
MYANMASYIMPVTTVTRVEAECIGIIALGEAVKQTDAWSTNISEEG